MSISKRPFEKEKEVERKVHLILAQFTGAWQTLITKNTGFDFAKIDPHYIALMAELRKQGFEHIAQSKIKPKPRPAKKILEAIAEDGHLTPALLDEIERSVK